MALVNDKGDVMIDDQHIGVVSGFQFHADTSGMQIDTLKDILAPHFHLAVERFYLAHDNEMSLDPSGKIFWGEALVGRLGKGERILAPLVVAFADDLVTVEQKEKIERRLSHFVERKISEVFSLLELLEKDETLVDLARNVGNRIVENLGVLSREVVKSDIKALDQESRALLRKHRLRFGQHTLYIPDLLKPAPTTLRLLLWSIFYDEGDHVPAPPPGLVTIPKQDNYEPHHYILAGYRLLGARAIRVDMLERLSDLLRNVNQAERFEASPDMLSITGLSNADFADLLSNLGFSVDVSERIKPSKTAIIEADTAVAQEADPQNIEEDTPQDVSPAEDAMPIIEKIYSFQMVRASKPTRPKQSKDKKTFKKPAQKQEFIAPKRPKKMDPDNPFAVLAAIRENL